MRTLRQEFPNTIFLLEGLGGALETTDQLLSEGGMQWAYSELFQNHKPADQDAELVQGGQLLAMYVDPRVGR